MATAVEGPSRAASRNIAGTTNETTTLRRPRGYGDVAEPQYSIDHRKETSVRRYGAKKLPSGNDSEDNTSLLTISSRITARDDCISTSVNLAANCIVVLTVVETVPIYIVHVLSTMRAKAQNNGMTWCIKLNVAIFRLE